MNQADANDDLGVTQELDLDRICVEFEATLKAGDHPSIEEQLVGRNEPARSTLLRQLVLLEVEYEMETAAPESLADYCKRFPDDHALLREIFQGGAGVQPANTELPQTESSHHDSKSSSSSLHGRFEPGQRIAGRYRIVSLLGQGGMGEVYRADDLVLGQSVALKFLPEDLAENSKRLEYFFGEVRLARQVSHPHVCRVHDIGEVDGQHFISMEFIDGEDLKTLLTRIGRLPEDKGIEIAQQLCHGLAAAHNKGVLHRDMKPANVMLDGQGQVRITDFGLATFDQSDRDGQSLVGTPAYMAPEQLSQGKTSVKSDIYSLGLVLHEIFTGQRPQRDNGEHGSSPSKPSDLVGGMDELVESAILSCLEIDPANRPASVAAVSQRLPGGDPLAAALAAGETPSPEAVANSGGETLLRNRTAILFVLAILAAICCTVVLQQRGKLIHHVAHFEAPAALRSKAREILRHLKHDDPVSHADGLDEPQTQQQTVKLAGEAGFSETWPAVGYWYRESQSFMWSPDYGGGPLGRRTTQVTDREPRWEEPGMAGVRLGPTGLLREYRSIPNQSAMAGKDKRPLPWADWFPQQYVGFNWETLQPAADWSVFVPVGGNPSYWEGNWPDSEEPLYVVTAEFANRPTYFRILHSHETVPPDDESDAKAEVQPQQWNVLLGVMLLINFVAVFLAVRNYRLGRGDVRGARRLVIYSATILFLSGIINATHVPTGYERGVWLINLAFALASAAEIWLMYMALEPLVRRTMPELLISWNRVLEGRFNDSRVGRDLLIGLAVGSWQRVLESIPPWTVWVPPEVFNLQVLGSPIRWFACSIGAFYWSVYFAFASVVMLAVFTFFVRKKMLAAGMLVTMITMATTAARGWPAPFWSLAIVSWTMSVVLLIRFGLVAAVGANLGMMLMIPISINPDDFYFPNGVYTVLLLVTLAVGSAYVATSGRLFAMDER